MVFSEDTFGISKVLIDCTMEVTLLLYEKLKGQAS